jgi:hypothetical protein
MDLALARATALQLPSVDLTKPRGVVAVGVPFQVLEVEQLQGDAGLGALGMNPRAFRPGTLPRSRPLGPSWSRLSSMASVSGSICAQSSPAACPMH